MGTSYNRAIIAGGMTRDPELRYTPSGTGVTEISLAITEKRKGPSGDTIEETTYVEVTLWGRTAEVVAEYCKKGSQLLIEGRLKLDTWQDKNTGDKRSKLKVVGERIQMLGGTKGAGGQGGNQGGGGSRDKPPFQQQDEQGGDYSQNGPDDDAGIPF